MEESLGIRQLDLIKAMRFPLIVLVVIAHSLPFGNSGITLSFDGWNVYHFFSEMISHNFARIAVCWFYVFSGYLFFRNLKDGEFCFGWVVGKWKKRINSLLIPYVIWNLLAVVLVFVKSSIFVRLGYGEDEGMGWIRQSGVVGWLWSGPANFPLYFMRDLMLMSILAPIWYVMVKKFKWTSLCLLVLVYCSPLNPSLPAMRAIFFFGLGCWMGIWKVNMLSICRRFKISALIVAIITLLVASYWNASDYHEWMLRFFYPFGMITFMNICDKLINNENRKWKMCSLASAVFFIYASHEIYILGWTKGLFLRIFGNGLLGSWVSYLFVPIVVLSVCLLLYWLFNRYMPKTLAFVSGGRVSKK